MNIDKNNYEEYFLLFADNELSQEEKKIVEVFVKEHTDLEEEFLNIIQSVVTPENDLKLEDKNSLFRSTKKCISHASYRQVFILYNDNELTGTERNEVEAFLAENPSLKNEFELLQKIKLQPDHTIGFPDKSLLFKKENGKVVLFGWWKAIAAAVVLGVGLWISINYQRKDKNNAPVTVKTGVPENTGKARSVPGGRVNLQPVNVVAENKPAKHSLKTGSFLKINTDKFPAKPAKLNEQALNKKRTSNHLPEPGNAADKVEKEESTVTAKEIQRNNIDNPVNINNDAGKVDNRELKQDEIANAGKIAVPGVLTTSYASDESENNNNYAFYNITEEKFNKSKVGGFLRKVKRIIERKISPLNNSKNQQEMTVN